MHHFVAYHSPEKMGRSLQEGDPFSLVTNKPVERLADNWVWFVESEGSKPKQYYLSSVFLVNETGQGAESGFKYYARGTGHAFQPRISLTELGWFPEFFKSVGRFGLGVREIADLQVVEELKKLAGAAGFVVA